MRREMRSGEHTIAVLLWICSADTSTDCTQVSTLHTLFIYGKIFHYNRPLNDFTVIPSGRSGRAAMRHDWRLPIPKGRSFTVRMINLHRHSALRANETDHIHASTKLRPRKGTGEAEEILQRRQRSCSQTSAAKEHSPLYAILDLSLYQTHNLNQERNRDYHEQNHSH